MNAEEQQHMANLELYRQQLGQIDVYLASVPDDQTYVKLRADLLVAITLTEQLLRVASLAAEEAKVVATAKQEVGEEEEEEEGDGDEDGDEMDEHDHAAETFSSSSSSSASAHAASSSSSSSSSSSYSSARAAPIHYPPAAAKAIGPLQVGEVIEVSGGVRPFAGVLVAMESADQARVKYFEYEQEVVLPLTSLSRIAPGQVTESNVFVGFKGQCKFGADQLYYDAEVTEVTRYGAKVIYPQFGNAEEVPLAYLRPLKQKQNVSADGTKLPKPLKIPDNLIITDRDTEEEKNRKRKKIKAIKSKNRIIAKETEQTVVQQSWQKFVAKGSKKSLVGLKTSSIFSTTDSVDSRVGVTGSGKGLTEVAERKKHK